MSASRQPHRELIEVTDFAVDRDGAAVLLRYDLVADRQPKPGALAGRDLQCRAVSTVALAAPLVSGIEAVAYEVEEHARHLLRHDVNRCEIAIEVALQCDVEAMILRTRTVISEVQGLL